MYHQSSSSQYYVKINDERSNASTLERSIYDLAWLERSVQCIVMIRCRYDIEASSWHRYGIAMISLWPRYSPQKRFGISRGVSAFLGGILVRENENKRQTSSAFSRSQLSNFVSICISTTSFYSLLSVHWRLSCLRDVSSRESERSHIARSLFDKYRRHRFFRYATVNLNRRWISSSRLSLSRLLSPQVRWIVSWLKSRRRRQRSWRRERRRSKSLNWRNDFAFWSAIDSSSRSLIATRTTIVASF